MEAAAAAAAAAAASVDDDAVVAKLLDPRCEFATLSAVFVAIHVRDKERLSAAIAAAGHRLNARNSEGRCAMHVAAALGYEDGVHELYKAGASVRLQDDSGLSPLHYSVRGGWPVTTLLLLSFGAVASATTASLDTPLHFAAQMGRCVVATAAVRGAAPARLLRAGVSRRRQSRVATPPLACALARNVVTCVRPLSCPRDVVVALCAEGVRVARSRVTATRTGGVVADASRRAVCRRVSSCADWTWCGSWWSRAACRWTC
jgi:hypothetical protein